MQGPQVVNLEKLDDYIVVRMQSAADLSPDNDDLRALDQNLGAGVYALWSEKGQGVVAFLFDKTHWDPADAKDWVAKAKDRAIEEGEEDPSDAPLYAFPLTLGDGADAGSDGDNLVWKEILHPGTWYKSDTGRPVEITPHIISEVFRAFSDGFPRYVSVPADHHWTMSRGIVPPEANRGFVKKLKKVGDRLFGGFAFTKPEVEEGVRDGSIADVSVYLQPGVHHNGTGKQYDWALRHVLLTNNPLASDLASWGDVPASDSDGALRIINHVQKHTEELMSEENEGITLTGEAAEEYESLRDAGYTSAQLLALAEQMTALQGVGLSVEGLIDMAQGLRQKSRDLAVARIIKALEGADAFEGVQQIEGYRHYPVVIEAVADALTQGVTDLAFASDDEGNSAIDALILKVVNAIPEAGRLPIAATEQGGRKDEKHTPTDGDAGADVSDSQIDKLVEAVG